MSFTEIRPLEILRLPLSVDKLVPVGSALKLLGEPPMSVAA